MKCLPVPRPRVYDLYWYFAAERQKVFEARAAGLCQPWTKDPILQTYKFCNVFRAADRVSQYLIRDVVYDVGPCTLADRLFQIVAFRFFSKSKTWDSLRARLGHQPTLADLKNGAFTRALDETKNKNQGLYTGAFILCATKAFGQ